MNVGSIAQQNLEASEVEEFECDSACENPTSPHDLILLFLVSNRIREELSPWSQSAAKRLFDCLCVLIMLPLLLPLLLAIALAVRLTSAGPVLFLQKRVGCHGRPFTILKFRTMIHDADVRYHAVTTADNQPFTSIGPFLRRWKFDELPQVFNVLLGHMSMVGPRPKMPEHVKVDLSCRPGITGAATIAFAREETILDRVPKHSLDDYYHKVVLPAKRQLDAEYMANATFFSDLKLIVDSVLRRWDGSVAEELLEAERMEAERMEAEARLRENRPEPPPIRTAASEPVSLHAGNRGQALSQ